MSKWYDEAALEQSLFLTPEVMKAAFPRHTGSLDEWANLLNHYLPLHGMDDPNTVALFLAHLGHESSDLNRLEENFNYAATALVPVFGLNQITKEAALRLGRRAGKAADKVAIANDVYGDAWGVKNLGNTELGDGWKYRGRGLIQLTGRANYKRCGDAILVDLIQYPDLLKDDHEVSLQAALWYWEARVTSRTLKGSTKQINGGYHGLDDRGVRYQRILKALEGMA